MRFGLVCALIKCSLLFCLNLSGNGNLVSYTRHGIAQGTALQVNPASLNIHRGQSQNVYLPDMLHSYSVQTPLTSGLGFANMKRK